MTSAAKINIKNIDYFKFKKIIIDGNRDDYSVCSKEVKALCDCVQTLSFRDEEFDAQSDQSRFDEICSYYRQILQSKRIDPLDMRIKSGWWGDHKTGYSAGKIKPTVLMEVLTAKTRDWAARHGSMPVVDRLEESFEGPGLYVFKHKEHQCFQFIEKSNNTFAKCSEKLKAAFEGSSKEPLAALLVISMVTDWDFYFLPVAATDGNRILRILENDLILKHDCIWPHGLNFSLNIDSLLEVSEFRKSCLRHHWPPESDVADSREINLKELRMQVSANMLCSSDKPSASVAAAAAADRVNESKSERPESHLSAPSKKPTAKAPPPAAVAAAGVAQAKTEPSGIKATASTSIPSSSQKSSFSSPSKLPSETKVPILSKSILKSPTKQTAPKQAPTNTEVTTGLTSAETGENVVTSPELDAPTNNSQILDEDEDPHALKRSNTFTYSDSESSDTAADPGSASSNSAAGDTQNQTKGSKLSAKASAAAKRIPAAHSQRS